MTKERRLAIQMWKDIHRLIEQRGALTISDLEEFKAVSCRIAGVEWKNACWLCQYVRKDYRASLESRADIPSAFNGCRACPLYKWYDKHYGCTYDMCACNIDECTIYSAFAHGTQEEQLDAAAVILRALEGEEIWTV